MKNSLIVSAEKLLPVAEKEGPHALIKPLMSDIFLYETNIAGTCYVEDESFFDGLKEGSVLVLRRESENLYDKRAILVLNEKEEKLGYVPRKDNVILSRLMDGGKILKAVVKDCHRDEFQWEVRIKIFLVDF